MRKFADLSRWATYKEPLKRFILGYDGNEEYYLNKEKVGSLNHGVDGPNCLSEHVNAMLGILVDEADTDEEKRSLGVGQEPAVIPDVAGGAGVRSLRCGATSMREGGGLAALLEPCFLARITGEGCGATRQVQVDPWSGVNGGGSANTVRRDDGHETHKLHSGLPAVAESGTATRQPPCRLATFGASSSGQALPAISVEVSAGPLTAFDSGPGAEFAKEDERQRRSFNPVTAATLVGKCACLLPPDLVRGRSVLDLGAW